MVESMNRFRIDNVSNAVFVICVVRNVFSHGHRLDNCLFPQDLSVFIAVD